MVRPIGRPRKPGRTTSTSFACYPKEITAIKAAARKQRFKTYFDYFRSLLIADDNPLVRGKIEAPRRV